MSLENLQALEVETLALDAEITAPTDSPPNAAAEQAGPPPIDYHAEAAQAVDMFASFVVGYAPKTAEIWNDGAKSRIAAALAPVLQKYGVNFGALPPELTLIIVAGPPLYMSAKIVAEQMRADRAKKPEAKEKPAPAAGDEAPETLQHPQMGLYA